MAFVEKIIAFLGRLQSVILPSLLVIGFGALQIKYPNAMDGFDDNYTGRGAAGLIMLLIELFLMLVWGKLGGIFAIAVGLFIVVISILPGQQQSPNTFSTEVSSAEVNAVTNTSLESDNDHVADTLRGKVLRFGVRTSKNYIQHHLDRLN